MMNRKRIQIAFDVPLELRQEIKVRAARRNISMNLWIMRAIYRALEKEDSFGTTKKQENEK